MDFSIQPELHKRAENYGIIEGVVLKDGQPLKGASIQVSDPQARVVYFTSITPDPGRQITSANGKFIIFFLNPGAHSIKSTFGSNESIEQIIYADKKTISQIKVDFDRSFLTQLQITAAFVDEAVESFIRVVGSSEVVRLFSGQGTVSISNQVSKAEYDIDAGKDYPVYRKSHFNKAKSGTVKLLDHSQLNTIKANAGLASLPLNAVGFSNENFEVDVYKDNLSSKIVYFDNQLNITPSGVAGGGFIILNSNKEQIYIQVLYESGLTHLENIWLTDNLVHMVSN